MPSFQMKFDTDNEAFEEGDEVSRILRDVAAKVDRGYVNHSIMDANGNRVGEWSYELPEPEDDDPYAKYEEDPDEAYERYRDEQMGM